MGWLSTAAPGWPAELGAVRTGAGDVGLRPLRAADSSDWRRLRLRDEALIKPWDPTSSMTWEQRHSRSAWGDHRAMLRHAARMGTAMPFAITVNGQFAGQVTVGGIQRFPLQSAWIGYWVSSQVAGHGVATVAVALVVGQAFGPGQLHRMEATVAPENVASRKVLTHLGFRTEGLLRRYLDIDGSWRDHHLFAITTEEVPDGADGMLRSWAANGFARP